MMTIGVLGGGQLGRMLALAGLPLGFRFRFLDPAPEPPAAAVGEHIRGDFGDPDALARFAQGLDVVTYEFDHVEPRALEWLETRLPVRPGRNASRIGGDRVEEKRFMLGLGARVAEFAEVDDLATLLRSIDRLGARSILKTRREGYDGRGQVAIESRADAEGAWDAIGRRPAVLERRVPFRRELAVIAVRSLNGELRHYPLVETRQSRGVLASALAPAPALSEPLRLEAEALAVQVAEALDYVGVLAIECFEHEDRLVVNELAPRVHNSGHWTIEGAITSQFENHVRAIAGLPLGSTEPRGHSGIVNLLGQIPPLDRVLAADDAHLHVYGKAARAGRKVGHVTFNASDPTLVLERMKHLEHAMKPHTPELERTC